MDRPTAWLRDPDAGEHGNRRAGWLGAAGRRHLDGLRGAERIAMAYERAKAVNAAAGGGIDCVRLR